MWLAIDWGLALTGDPRGGLLERRYCEALSRESLCVVEGPDTLLADVVESLRTLTLQGSYMVSFTIGD